MLKAALGVLIFAALPAASIAQTPPAPTTAPAAIGYSVEDTDIGTLLDDPAAKAVLDKNLPGFSSGEQIDMARSLALRSIQPYAPDMLTDKVLAAIQSDLAKLPVKK